jgi:hypothetical protein
MKFIELEYIDNEKDLMEEFDRIGIQYFQDAGLQIRLKSQRSRVSIRKIEDDWAVRKLEGDWGLLLVNTEDSYRIRMRLLSIVFERTSEGACVEFYSTDGNVISIDQ